MVTVGDSYQSLINGVEAEDIINLPFLRLFFLYSLLDKAYLYAGGFWRQKRRDDKVEIGLVDWGDTTLSGRQRLMEKAKKEEFLFLFFL